MEQMTHTRDVEFVNCLMVRFEPSWEDVTHCHNTCHEMIYVCGGEMATSILGQTFVGRSGNVLIYPQGMVHTPRSQGFNDLEFIVLRWCGGDFLARLGAPDVQFDRNQRIRRQMDWIMELYPSPDSTNQMMFNALMYSIIHEFGQLQNHISNDLALRIRSYIRTHLNQRITLADLSNEARMSKFHFARTFKEITGQTPINMVNQMRVEAAQELLMQTNLSLDAIAHQVGLADASHFSHMFRRITGRSPGSLRHDNRM